MKLFASLLCSLVFFTLLGLAPANGEKKKMEGKSLYRVRLVKDKSREVVVSESGKKLKLALQGFGKTIELDANSGGVSTCRTIIEHTSDQTTVTLSLPIPDPRAPCRMLPGYVSIESETYGISIEDANVQRISGGDRQLRQTVQKILGKIEEE